MTPKADLEKLYEGATDAIASKEYDAAASLLKRILVQDENYKDASRLLAQIIRRKRRRWYTSPFLFGGLSLVALVLLGVFLAPRLRSSFVTQVPMPIVKPTDTPVPTLASTSIPLAWKRINLGTQFPRDAITAIAIDPRDSLVIYVGTADAGIFKSIDGGMSWRPVQNGLTRAQINRLVLDPVNAGTLYASTQGSLFKTTDGGVSWQELAEGREFSDGSTNIVVDPQNNQTLYYATQPEVYRSTDGGTSWNLVKPGGVCPDQIYFQAFIGHPTKSGVLYASHYGGSECQAGLYRSTNGGQTWDLIGLKGEENIGHIAVGSDLRGNEVLFVSYNRALYASSDDGKTWSIILQGGCGENLLVDKNQPTTIYCGLSKSTSGGVSWRQTLASLPHSVMAVAIPNDGTYLVAGTDSGLFISTDNGASWVERSNGLAGSFIDLRLSPSDPSTFYAKILTLFGGESGLYLSSDGAQSWDRISKGELLAIDKNGGMYRREGAQLIFSQDKGKTWTVFPMPLSDPQATDLGANLAQSGSVFVVFDNRVFFSSNFGASWEESILPPVEEARTARFFFDLDQGQRGYMISSWVPLKTTDAGKTWNECAGINWSPLNHSILVIDPRNSQRVILAFLGKGLVRSEDGCQTWIPSNEGLGSLFLNSIAIDPNDPDTIYAGTDGGAFVSFDWGNHWGAINDGLLGATVVYSIVVDPQSNVYAATPYGIFKLEGK
jgi:photosystem II stability/assembly factor-like uncharacterized protein